MTVNCCASRRENVALAPPAGDGAESTPRRSEFRITPQPTFCLRGLNRGNLCKNMGSRVVLITGTSKGGIGYELCQTFHQRGFKVYAAARNLDKLDGLPADVGKVSMDVDDEEDIEKAIKVLNFSLQSLIFREYWTKLVILIFWYHTITLEIL